MANRDIEALARSRATLKCRDSPSEPLSSRLALGLARHRSDREQEPLINSSAQVHTLGQGLLRGGLRSVADPGRHHIPGDERREETKSPVQHYLHRGVQKFDHKHRAGPLRAGRGQSGRRRRLPEEDQVYVFDVTEFGECVPCGAGGACDVGECVPDARRRGLRFGMSTSGCCRGT